jgi:hypothetical protein
LLTQIQSPLPPLDDTKNDTNARTAQLVQLISEIGPDIPEISRRLGQFKESVRYRYKQKLLDKGLAIQAMSNHEKLGLRRVIALLDFAPYYKGYAESILTVMSEICYVVAFEAIFPQDMYVAQASVPSEYVEEYSSLLKNLEAKGIFTVKGIYEFDWFRNKPMMAHHYDFDTGRWDFDWSFQSKGEFEGANYLPDGRAKFDYTDLLLLKELYIDASRSLVEISKKLGVNYKKLVWHLSTHVIPSRLVKGYTVRWPGTRYDSEIDRALHRQHRYFGVDVLVKDLNEKERMGLMAQLNRLPFLWSEAGGRNYFAQLAIPVDFHTEAFQYLQTAISEVRDRTELYLPDQTRALAFTIGYKLYDQEQRRWTFDSQRVARGFDELIVKLKEAGREPA